MLGANRQWLNMESKTVTFYAGALHQDDGEPPDQSIRAIDIHVGESLWYSQSQVMNLRESLPNPLWKKGPPQRPWAPDFEYPAPKYNLITLPNYIEAFTLTPVGQSYYDSSGYQHMNAGPAVLSWSVVDPVPQRNRGSDIRVSGGTYQGAPNAPGGQYWSWDDAAPRASVRLDLVPGHALFQLISLTPDPLVPYWWESGVSQWAELWIDPPPQTGGGGGSTTHVPPTPTYYQFYFRADNGDPSSALPCQVFAVYATDEASALAEAHLLYDGYEITGPLTAQEVLDGCPPPF